MRVRVKPWAGTLASVCAAAVMGMAVADDSPLGYVPSPLDLRDIAAARAARVRFSAVVRLATSDAAYPIIVEMPSAGYSSAAQAAAGESFCRPAEGNYAWEDLGAKGINCCIKVYTRALGDASEEPLEEEPPETLYVDAACTAALPDGLTPETAYTNLSAAAAAARPGMRVLVAPGTYAPVWVSVSNVAFVATGGPAVTVIDGGGYASCVVGDVSDYSISFTGFTLTRGAGTWLGFDDGGSALCGGGAYGVTLVGCVVSNCTATIGGGTFNCDHFNCLLARNTADGGYAGGAALGYLVGCTVVANAAASYCGGIDYTSFAGNSIVWGNTVGDGSCADCEDSAAGSAELYYTCTPYAPVYGQTDAATASVGVVTNDPRFVSSATGDWRLRPSSPCRDAGATDWAAVYSVDLAGAPRVEGAAPDLGAYEGGFPGTELHFESVADWYSGVPQTAAAVFVTDTNWTAQTSADWIAGWSGAGLGDATRRFTLAANTSGVLRTGTLVLADATGAAVTQTIRQAAQAFPPAVGQRVRGLFVGLNTYALAGASALAGAVNDACGMHSRMTQWGYCRASDATLLTNACATVAQVRGAITNLAAAACTGDTVVYYHSGHGVSFGGTDMALVLYDGYYRDAELAADLSLFAAGVKVVVMADTCYSGGLFRSMDAPLFDLAGAVRAHLRRRTPLVRAARARVVPVVTQLGVDDVGWVTAAGADELSWENGLGGGLFTTACLAVWRDGSADTDGDGRITFYELWRAAKDVGAAQGTTAQCANEELLCRVYAGVTDASTSETETFNTPVRVPYAWLDAYMAAWGYTPVAGAVYSFADYAAAAAHEKVTPSGRTVTAWQDYVAGTDPTVAEDVFTATIAIVDGAVSVSWQPRLSAAEEARRIYTRYGKNRLEDAWGPVTPASQFFKVGVQMK